MILDAALLIIIEVEGKWGPTKETTKRVEKGK